MIRHLALDADGSLLIVCLRDDRIWRVTLLNRIVLKTVTGRPTARERRQLAALRAVQAEPARLAEPGPS